jgi:hypothetical protein
LADNNVTEAQLQAVGSLLYELRSTTRRCRRVMLGWLVIFGARNGIVQLNARRLWPYALLHQ